MEPTQQEITAFVNALSGGEDASLGKLFMAAYEELRGVAHAQRRGWFGLETLSTTALVHEAYLSLARQDDPVWQDRGHFFRVAARAMRFILINYVKRGGRVKRGGASVHVPADEAPLIEASDIEELLALDEALSRLASRNRRWTQVVECRVFAGLDVEETAEALDVSPTTVKRDWRRAQAWLHSELRGASHDEDAKDD